MNDPQVSTAVKEVAVRSLADRAREKLNLVRFFRYNAAAKHGVPLDYEANGIQIPADTQQQPTAATTTPSTSRLGQGVLIGLLTAAGLVGAGYTGYKLSKPAVKPERQVQKQQLPYESPLQWLEDQGDHMP